MTRRLILGLGCCVLLAASARAELNREQLVELRARLDQLADAVAAGQTNETHRLAASLQRWARQQDASLPVDLICERVLVFPPDNEARQLSASIRQLAGNLDAVLAQQSPGND